jgi:hypothetical protein
MEFLTVLLKFEHVCVLVTSEHWYFQLFLLSVDL